MRNRVNLNLEKSVRSRFARSSLWGKFGGFCACGATFPYIVPLPNILQTRLFSKTEIEKEGLPRDGTPDLRAGGPLFKSGRPDQNYLPYFLPFMKSVLHPKLQRGNPAGRSAHSQIIG
jgi:hypothetical protein